MGGAAAARGGVAPHLPGGGQAAQLLRVPGSHTPRSVVHLSLQYSQRSKVPFIHFLSRGWPRAERGQPGRDRAARLQRPLQQGQQPAGQTRGQCR